MFLYLYYSQIIFSSITLAGVELLVFMVDASVYNKDSKSFSLETFYKYMYAQIVNLSVFQLT